MLKRTAYGAIAILAILTLFSVDAAIARWAGGSTDESASPPAGAVLSDSVANLLRHGSVVPLGLAVLIVMASAEFMRLLEAKGANPNRLFAQVMLLAIFLSPWLSAGGWLGDDVAAVEGLYWPLVLIAMTPIGAGALHLFRGQTDGSLRDIGATCLAVLYIGFLSSFALQLRSGADSPAEQGVWLLLITLLVTKASDIGAYFAGSLWGRRRLAPRISPKKSVEGAIGGIVGSSIVAVGLALAAPAARGLWPQTSFALVVHEIAGIFGAPAPGGLPVLARAFLFGAALSISGQIGDLFESCFKRDAGIKDSGSVLPQFGGILDLIDSPVFAVPVAWFMLTRVWHVI